MRLGPNFLLVCLSILGSLGLMEGVIRLIVNGKLPDLGGLRTPSFYADYFTDDDYWKLYHKFGSRPGPPDRPHPLLGWVGSYDRESYHHDSAGEVDDRTPVLLYGDSFAACATEVCFEDLLRRTRRSAPPLHEPLHFFIRVEMAYPSVVV